MAEGECGYVTLKHNAFIHLTGYQNIMSAISQDPEPEGREVDLRLNGPLIHLVSTSKSLRACHDKWLCFNAQQVGVEGR